MLGLKLYKEIVDNEHWLPYLNIVKHFRTYLVTTNDSTFRVSGIYKFEGEDFTISNTLPYIHRWTDLYKKGVLARFYSLERELKGKPVNVVTMMTLTTYHGVNALGEKSKDHNETILEGFTLLKEGWSKLRQRLRGIDYVWIMEPHKTGFPHIHVVILEKIDKERQMRLKRLWAAYGCGSVKYGIKFTEKQGPDNIKSIRNYLMKYLVKSWIDSDWTTGQLVFNAIVWENDYRLWGASTRLSKIMRRSKPEPLDVEWQKTEIKATRFSDHNVLWRKEGTDLKPFDFDEYGNL